MKPASLRWPAVFLALALAAAPAAMAQSVDATPESQQLSQRLRNLDADPQNATAAAYERLQAQQALQTLAATRGKQRAFAYRIAERRVETAETAVRAEANRRQIERLEQQRNELLLEASRQDAARARAEAERLRVEAQIQAEEAQRLRLQAEADANARQQADALVSDIGATEAEKLRFAREREAELARQEAELQKASGANPAKPAKPKPRAGKK